MDDAEFERLVRDSKDPNEDVQAPAWDALTASLDPRALAYVLESVERIAANPQAFETGLGDIEDIFIQAAPRSIGPLLEYFETGNPTSQAMRVVASSLGEIGYLAGVNQDPRIIPATVEGHRALAEDQRDPRPPGTRATHRSMVPRRLPEPLGPATSRGPPTDPLIRCVEHRVRQSGDLPQRLVGGRSPPH